MDNIVRELFWDTQKIFIYYLSIATHCLINYIYNVVKLHILMQYRSLNIPTQINLSGLASSTKTNSRLSYISVLLLLSPTVCHSENCIYACTQLNRPLMLSRFPSVDVWWRLRPLDSHYTYWPQEHRALVLTTLDLHYQNHCFTCPRWTIKVKTAWWLMK